MIAGLLVATFGMACQGGQEGPEPNATAREEAARIPGFPTTTSFSVIRRVHRPARELGKAMRLGIEAAFHEANQDGGVHGRELRLTALDDGYETDFCRSNTQRLIENETVFALIGAVGTPTSRAASPLAQAAGVPFLAPFTGAEFLRGRELDNVLNLRASYYQETEEMVARLTEDLGITRVAVFYRMIPSA